MQGLEIQIFLIPKLVFLSTLHFNLKCTVKYKTSFGKGSTLTVHFQLAEISSELTCVQGSSRMPQGLSNAKAAPMERKAIPGTKQPATAPLNKRNGHHMLTNLDVN